MLEKRIIEKMVKAMEVEADDKVLLNFWGEDENLADLQVFEQALTEAGIEFQTLSHCSKEYVALFSDGTDSLNEEWYQRFADMTIVIDLMCQAPGVLPQGLAEDKVPLFAGHLRRLFAIFASKKKLIQVTMPTETNAKLAGVDATQYIERITRALDVDYAVLKEECKKKIDEFKGDMRTIRTGENCVLTVDTTNRAWVIDAGDGALPCGEIYIAPVEENSNGKIFFETLSMNGAGVVKNVTVTIQDGRIMHSDCDEFNDFIKELPEGGNVVAELGIGMNPNVSAAIGDSDLDENALGTLHIGIGMNHLFGGKNQCPCHFDFVTTGVVE